MRGEGAAWLAISRGRPYPSGLLFLQKVTKGSRMAGQERIAWVDVFKGYAIILVVIGHTGSPLGLMIYAFHMPAFFFISGYVTDLDRHSIPEFLYRRARTLLVPFISLNLLLIGWWIGASATRVGRTMVAAPADVPRVYAAVRQLFTDWNSPIDVGGATWFLIALFGAAVLAKLTSELLRNMRLNRAWGLAIVGFLWLRVMLVHQADQRWPFEMDLAVIGAVYYYLGFLTRRLNVFEKHIRHGVAIPVTAAIMALVGSYYWVKQDFPGRHFSTAPECLIASFAGIYALFVVARYTGLVAGATRVVAFVGRQSLAILALHFLGFRLGYLMLFALGKTTASQLTLVTPHDQTVAYWIPLTVVALVFSLAIARLMEFVPGLASACLGQSVTSREPHVVHAPANG